jgi:hypothetical protein
VTEVVGTAEHYAEFVWLCRSRIEQLGITMETVDALCGFPARYTAILLCENRAMSVFSFFTMARALALLPVFQHDEAQFEHLHKREDWIATRRKGPRWRLKRMLNGSQHRARSVKIYPDFMRKRAMLAVAARMRKLSPKRRSAIARRAALARWGNGAGRKP